PRRSRRSPCAGAARVADLSQAVIRGPADDRVTFSPMAIIADAVTRFPDSVYVERLRRVRAEAAARGIGALLVTPSIDYEYLLGYRAPALERLTCLILPADGT